MLQSWGATRATLVTYLLPIVGVSAGALVLGEVVDWRLLVGGLLILVEAWVPLCRGTFPPIDITPAQGPRLETRQGKKNMTMLTH